MKALVINDCYIEGIKKKQGAIIDVSKEIFERMEKKNCLDVAPKKGNKKGKEIKDKEVKSAPKDRQMTGRRRRK